MRFGILGPVEVTSDVGPVSIGQPRHRAVLGYLLLHRNRIRTLDQVADALWGGAEPASARAQVHVAVSGLRRALRAAGLPGVIGTQPAGYRLALGEDDLDAGVFAQSIADARRALAAGAHSTCIEAAQTALALWRGEPLAGITAAFAAPARHALHEQRLSAYELIADAELALGRPESVTALLRDLVEEHPLREPLVGRLMVALHHSGRGAEAMQAYGRLRARLAEEFGTDPGPQLREIHVGLLRQTPSAAEPARFVPQQLPAAAANFSGRTRQLAILDKLVAVGQPGAVVITAIAGTAGVGKTTLAVHWAHRVAHRYPDGQIYLNLQGFDHSGPPMATGVAIRNLLDAVAPPAHHIPEGFDAQIGLYRSLLAGRRMLILLDNARDAAQVQPLLPGSPGCLTIVTSRNQLSGLVAAEGAHPVALDLMPPAEAHELIATRLGHDRVHAEADAVEEIIGRCAGLPLALAIITARAASYPDFPLSALAADLSSARTGLDALAGGDSVTDLRAVFSWSYQALSAVAARLFRLLGLLPGPDFAAPAAASLLGVAPHQLRPALVELTRAHLVTEHLPGRYAIHDLLREFAAELVEADDALPDRDAAAGRLLDHYLHTAYAADRIVQPHRLPITLGPPGDGVTVRPVDGHDQAMAWFTTESSALVAATEWAASHGYDQHAWQLAWTLENFFDRRGSWEDWVQTQRIAVTVTGRLGDRRALADAQRGLAMALMRLRRHDEAHHHYRESLELWRTLGHDVGQARTHFSIAHLLEQQGQRAEALYHAKRALELFPETGEGSAYARALNAVGWMHALHGDFAVAQDYCDQALQRLRALGDRKAEAHTLDSLGYVHAGLGDHAQAVAYYGQAVEQFREVGDRYNEATALDGKAQAHQASGDSDAAVRAWRNALVILEDLRHPAASDIRARLTQP